MYALIITILFLVLMFKITGLIFRIFGKILGVVFSILGYVILGGLAVGLVGTAILVVPILAVGGIFSLFRALLTVV